MAELTQYEKVVAWNEKWNKGRSPAYVPVAYNPNPEETDPDYIERNITTAYGMAYLSAGTDGERFGMVQLSDYAPYRAGARLDHLEVLDEVAAGIRELKKVDGNEAIHHNPECPDCYQEMAWDEGFDCPICFTHYEDNGQFSHRPCVEYDCENQAEVIGLDEQPRCIPCQTLIVAEDTTSSAPPYHCATCRVLVTGLPGRSQAAKNRLCRSHQSAKNHRDYMSEIMGRKY